MSDAAFELRLERAARRIADEAVRPVDAVAIAGAAIRAADRLGENAVPRLGVRRPWSAIAVVGLAAILAIVGSLSLLRSGTDVGASPSPSPSPSPTTLFGPSAPVAVSPDAARRSTWLADVPTGLVFGRTDQPERMALTVEDGLIASIDLVDGSRRLFASSFLTINVGEVQLSTVETVAADSTHAAGDAVTVDGALLAGCRKGDEGHYQTTTSRNGLVLTFELLSDACPSRAAVLARSWTRSISVPNGGGPGVVDAFDPLFTVDLPAGTYQVGRSPGSLTIYQDLPELQLVALKDPTGYIDPCDQSKGRFGIAPGADAVVAYYRQLSGFTVESATGITVDGHRAVRLVVHADADATCPDGKLWMLQTKAEPGTLAWFSTPGITDSFVIVEHPRGTVMLEVLPAPNDLEDQVIGSIRFLDALPTTP